MTLEGPILISIASTVTKPVLPIHSNLATPASPAPQTASLAKPPLPPAPPVTLSPLTPTSTPPPTPASLSALQVKSSSVTIAKPVNLHVPPVLLILLLVSPVSPATSKKPHVSLPAQTGIILILEHKPVSNVQVHVKLAQVHLSA